ncbi:MAG: hypothetical protein ACLQED_10475 [Desulfobaccales bacterium]
MYPDEMCGGGGVDPVTAANAMMAAKAQMEVVRQCLASLGYAGADSYSYGVVAGV